MRCRALNVIRSVFVINTLVSCCGGTMERTIPGSLTASETFDVGLDTNSPVADDYFDQAPFGFNGTLTLEQ